MIDLINTTPLINIIYAGRCCYDSIPKMNNKRDIELLDIWKENNHLSVFDHMWFQINVDSMDDLHGYLHSFLIYDNILKRYVYIDYNYSTDRYVYYINLRTIFEIIKEYDKKDLPISLFYIINMCLDKFNELKKEYVKISHENKFKDGVHILYRNNDKIPFTTLYLKNCFSRDLLHQFIRHYSFRSIKSTRYTLKKKLLSVNDFYIKQTPKINKFLNKYIADFNKLSNEIKTSDELKSVLIESLKSSGVFTFYNYDLSNMLKIRDENDNRVYWKFRYLTKEIKHALYNFEINNKTCIPIDYSL